MATESEARSNGLGRAGGLNAINPFHDGAVDRHEETAVTTRFTATTLGSTPNGRAAFRLLRLEALWQLAQSGPSSGHC